MSPTVSIVTPFLNAEGTLGEAIDSLRAQTFQDWELILVDDGSVDTSPAVAAQAAAGDSRIRVLPPEPRAKGAAAARNAGLRAARGAFLGFLDADDLFMPHKLATELAAFAAHPEAMAVYGSTLWWHPDAPQRDWTEQLGPVANRLNAPPEILRRVLLLEEGHVPCTCAILIRREALEAVGGFEERFRLYEDQTLWAKLFLSFPVYVSDHCVAYYRQHAASVSAQAQESGEYDRLAAHPARVAFLDWLAGHIDASGIGDKRLARALRLARAPYIQARTPLQFIDKLYLAGRSFKRRTTGRLRRLMRRL